MLKKSLRVSWIVVSLPRRMTIGVRADVKVSFLKSLFDGVSHLLITGFLRLPLRDFNENRTTNRHSFGQ